MCSNLHFPTLSWPCDHSRLKPYICSDSLSMASFQPTFRIPVPVEPLASLGSFTKILWKNHVLPSKFTDYFSNLTMSCCFLMPKVVPSSLPNIETISNVHPVTLNAAPMTMRLTILRACDHSWHRLWVPLPGLEPALGGGFPCCGASKV